uniref:CMP-N-acetylneuraminate-beta-galactosamide-alpha-2,3-sialyltransferase 1-like n=1 Tax=Seriola lalandi dorsalis TaxID=1841481 RepID=A0A3B4WTH9_SERLL
MFTFKLQYTGLFFEFDHTLSLWLCSLNHSDNSISRRRLHHHPSAENNYLIIHLTKEIILPLIQVASSDRCRTCAVVGNSGNLNGSRYGPLIDFHDVIIRINSGRTKGYEADVGKRTTHHVMYPESAVDLDNTTHLVLVPFKIQDLEWLIKAFTTGSYMPVKSHIKANKDLVMVVNPAFMRYVHDTWLEKKGRYPSTGFMALVLALHICDEVSVFGYGADKDGNWSHYWEKLKKLKLKTGVHPGSHEYDIIKQLAENQTVGFYTGW